MTNILSLIKEHHQIMKDSIKVLKDESAPKARKQDHLFLFLEMLKAHAKSEQESLYEALETMDELKLIAMEAREEHDIADRLCTEIEALGYENKWTEVIEAKAKVIADFVELHITEEEDEMFEKIKKGLNAAELEDLAADYVLRFNERLAELNENPLGQDQRLIDKLVSEVAPDLAAS